MGITINRFSLMLNNWDSTLKYLNPDFKGSRQILTRPIVDRGVKRVNDKVLNPVYDDFYARVLPDKLLDNIKAVPIKAFDMIEKEIIITARGIKNRIISPVATSINNRVVAPISERVAPIVTSIKNRIAPTK